MHSLYTFQQRFLMKEYSSVPYKFNRNIHPTGPKTNHFTIVHLKQNKITIAIMLRASSGNTKIE